MQDFKKEVKKMMLANQRHFGEHQYTVPSPETYPFQWLWDSCFHAIILTHFDPESAKKEILSLVSKQFENGLIPHIIFWKKENIVAPKHTVIDWGKEDTSTITQPPMLAYAAWRIYQIDPDKKFLNKIYKNLFHYYKYLINERDPHERNLTGIINPEESGEDNSPRFDIPLGLSSRHTLRQNELERHRLKDRNRECNFDAPFCMKNFFWVKDVPFNAIMIENLEHLANIAREIGYDYDASYFQRQRLEMIEAMKTLMKEDELFWSTYGEDYKKIKVKTWAIFAPLFAKILSKEEAEDLVKNYLQNEKEFKTKYYLPTVSISEEAFDPKCYWRGPVWMNVNWFVYKGLKNYGLDEAAEKIKENSIALYKKSGFREYFDPQTGEGLGAKNFTWAGLILDMN